ncbi:MAG: class I SAM-dependent methyltransferase [Anaerolineae bacterium]
MTTQHNGPPGIGYLDMQAYVGITKHNGGYPATKELLSLCHIGEARDVLNVGCGIGVASAFIAKKYKCRVVGVDISEKMIRWSRQRAKDERVEDKVGVGVASVLELPFAADRFDVVVCESVLAFVQDKRQAIRECIRVTKTGGYVGLNEAFFAAEASPELVPKVQDSLGTDIPTVADWQALRSESALQERVVRLYKIDPSTEVTDRPQWVGWRWAVRAWGRLLRLYVTNPQLRQSIREMFDAPAELMRHMGYGLFVGRKE